MAVSSTIKNTDDISIGLLFSGKNKFQIPPFQRSYDWGTRNINNIWDSIINNGNDYFIGNLVLIDGSTETDERKVVIDGQQRLTTTCLLLSAIKSEYNEIKPKNDDEAKRINSCVTAINTYLYHTDSSSWPQKITLRLLPGKKNLQDIFEDILENRIGPDYDKSKLDDNQLKYLKNFLLLKKLVREYIVEARNRFEGLNQLTQKVASLVLIEIVCSTDSDAYKIFEGLNATSLSLTVADLVKNAVIQAAKTTTSREEVGNIWAEIESLFEGTKLLRLPKFIRHQWISREGYISNSKLFDSIKVQMLKNKEPKDIVDYATLLLNDAKIYLAFLYAKYENFLTSTLSQKAITKIKKFRCLDFEQIYELLLAIYNKYSTTSKYTEKQLIQDLDKLWSFSFRVKFLTVNPSSYERLFAAQALKITKYKGDDFNTLNQAFYSDLSKLVSDDKEFTDNFINEFRYKPNGSDNGLINEVLGTIINKQQHEIKVSEPSIEHILPQAPIKWGLSEGDVKDFVHKIGNLTLLHEGDNRSLGNATLSDKIKRVYGVSSLRLNKEILSYKKNYQDDPRMAIELRGAALARMALEIWKV